MNRARKYLAMCQDESLEEHDRHYHGGNFDPKTMECGKRDNMTKGDTAESGITGKEKGEFESLNVNLPKSIIEKIDSYILKHGDSYNFDLNRFDVIRLWIRKMCEEFRDYDRVLAEAKRRRKGGMGQVVRHMERMRLENLCTPDVLQEYSKPGKEVEINMPAFYADEIKKLSQQYGIPCGLFIFLAAKTFNWTPGKLDRKDWHLLRKSLLLGRRTYRPSNKAKVNKYLDRIATDESPGGLDHADDDSISLAILRHPNASEETKKGIVRNWTLENEPWYSERIAEEARKLGYLAKEEEDL